MIPDSFNFVPFNSSIALNTLTYTLLMLICLLFSNNYMAQVVKRYSIKSRDGNEAVSSFKQALIIAIPFLFQCFTHGILNRDSLAYLTSIRSITMIAGIGMCTLAQKKFKKIPVERDSAISFIAMILTSTIPNITFEHLNTTWQTIFTVFSFLISLAVLGKTLRPGMRQTSSAVIVEPSSNKITKILAFILFPFEVLFENLVILTDAERKVYSLDQAAKLFISPTILGLFTSFYYNINDMKSILLVLLVSAGVGSLMYVLVLRKRIYHSLAIYNTSTACLIQFFIIDQGISTSKNLSKLFNFSEQQGSFVFVVPLFVIPSISILNCFIRQGFHSRTLLSLFHFAIISMNACTILNLTILEMPKMSDLFLRCSFGCLAVMLILTLMNTFWSGEKFTSNGWLVPFYIITQDYFIAMFYDIFLGYISQ